MKMSMKNVLALCCLGMMAFGCQSDEPVDRFIPTAPVVSENPYALDKEEVIAGATAFLEGTTNEAGLRSFSAETLTPQIEQSRFSVTVQASTNQSQAVCQQVPVYTVNYTDDQGKPAGFVVMAGDERVHDPVLIYGSAGTRMDLDAREDKAFIEELIAGYLHRAVNENPANENPQKALSLQLRNAYNARHYSVGMLYDWNQHGEPFRRYTPFRDEERTVPGCVAVAMGRIMAHHKWPRQGSFRRYDNPRYSTIIYHVEYNDAEWEDIKTAGYLGSVQSNHQACELIANLVVEIGYKINMDYRTRAQNQGWLGSFAQTKDVPAVYSQMGYKTNGFHEYDFAKVEEDIVKKRIPVYMSGCKPNGGCHAYVIAGLTYYDVSGIKYLSIYSGNGDDIHAEGFHSTYSYNAAFFYKDHKGSSEEKGYPYNYWCQIVTGIQPDFANRGSSDPYYKVKYDFPY